MHSEIPNSMSSKSDITSSKIVISYTQTRREAERKFDAHYPPWIILLSLLGMSGKVNSYLVRNPDFPVQSPKCKL